MIKISTFMLKVPCKNTHGPIINKNNNGYTALVKQPRLSWHANYHDKL